MVIYLLGGFLFFTGGAFLLGLYELMQAGEVHTVTQIVIPCVHLLAGVGIFWKREWGRRFALALAFFGKIWQICCTSG